MNTMAKHGLEDHWEFWTNDNGRWNWRRTSPNGRKVGESFEAYRNKKDCVANARRNGYQPEQTNPNRTSMEEDEWSFIQDDAEGWRWRRLSPNGRIVGHSCDFYRNRKDCENNAIRHGYLKPQRGSKR